MIKWLKKLFYGNSSAKSTVALPILKHYVNHPYLWRIDFVSVSRAVAIGLFVCVITLIPFQMILAASLAILIRANIPIAIGVTWICNPVTFLPITYLNYSIGNWILRTEEKSMITDQFHWQLHSFNELISSLSAWFLQFGKAFFIGVPFVAISAAIVGYLLVMVFWYGKHWVHKRKN